MRSATDMFALVQCEVLFPLRIAGAVLNEHCQSCEHSMHSVIHGINKWFHPSCSDTEHHFCKGGMGGGSLKDLYAMYVKKGPS